MKYYRDPETLTVYAYEADGSQDGIISPGLVPMTQDEVEGHINPKPLPPTRDEVNALRRIAYADPMTGSDPLYIEYQRSIAMSDPADQIESAKTAWLHRAAEIALQYPWP